MKNALILSMALGIGLMANAQVHQRSNGVAGTANARVPMVSAEGIKGIPSRPYTPGSSYASNPLLIQAMKAGRAKPKGAKPVMRVGANGGEVYGCLAYTEEWGKDLGVYTMPLDGTETMTLVEPNIRANGGGTYANGKYYYCEYLSSEDVYTFIFDADTWDVLFVGDGDTGIIARDLDYDPVGKQIYGTFIGENGTEWGILNQQNYTRNTIATMSPGVHAFAFDATGQAYGVGFDGNLYKINKNTGETTLIGATGLMPYYDSSATFDKANGRMYYTLSTDGVSGLYEINTSTGAATLITRFHNQEEVCGLYFPDAPISPTAPSMAQNVTLDFASGSLTGSLKFTAPTASYGGGTLSGVLNYSVSMDGQRVSIGTASPGQAVSVPVTVEKSGAYNFIINFTNVGGAGQPAYVNGYIGYAAPASPTNVTLEYRNDKFYLDWKASNKAATEGAFSAAEVRYRVKRFPGGEVAADGLTACNFTEDAAVGTSGAQYYYTVEAVNHDAYSTPAESNRLSLQLMVPPYYEDFTAKNCLDTWTIYGYSGSTMSWEWAGDNTGTYDNHLRIQATKNYPKDDWAFTPGLRLEAGNIYTFSVDAWVWSHKYGEEYLTIVASDEPSDEGHLTVVVPKTQIMAVTEPGGGKRNFDKLTADFQCTKSGVYYFGIHAEAEPDVWIIEIDNVSVGAAQIAGAPAAVSDLTVRPDAQGALSAVVEFTTPTLTIGGEALDAIESMTLSRDGVALKTFDAPAKGTRLSFSDTGLTAGLHTYTLVGKNSYGTGNTASATAYVGINAPAAPEKVNIVETGNVGEVTLSWPAVTTDRDGRPLNTTDLTYIIADNGDIISSNVKGTSHTFQAVPAEGNQQFVSYTVYAMTSGGRSAKATASEAIPVGAPYTTPYLDSFEEGGYTHLQNVTPANSMLKWSIWSVDDMQLETPDGDNYMLAARGSNVGDNSMWETGKIKLPADEVAALSFYYYGMTENENYFDVKINDGSGWQTLRTIVAGSPQAWHKVMIHLRDYVGKTVRIGFDGHIVTHAMFIFDAIGLSPLAPVNLTADALRIPTRFEANTPVDVEVDVINNGQKATDNYTVVLYRNDKKVATAAGTLLASGEKTTVTISESAPVTSTTLVYRAEVVCPDDADTSDNVTFDVTSHLILPNFPAPTALEINEVENTIELDWKGINLGTQLPDAITDDFETYEAFAINKAGDWNFIDADGSQTYGFEGVPFPNEGSPMAYIVFNNSGSQFNQSFATTSGQQFMATLVTYGGQNDDWMISPRLYGEAQTISFFAKSYSDMYGLESFEILYSTKTRTKGDFVSLTSVDAVPTDWTEYSFALPTGARYVAVRCTSTDRMMFMLDDFTYVPYGAEVDPLTLVGYNVYRDEEKLTEQPISVTFYTDLRPLNRDHCYCVTAVYDRGESAPSNVVSLNSSAVEDVPAQAVQIYTLDGNIVVYGAEGRKVSVNSIEGYSLFASPAAPEVVKVAASTGIYIVTVDGRSYKLIL